MQIYKFVSDRAIGELTGSCGPHAQEDASSEAPPAVGQSDDPGEVPSAFPEQRNLRSSVHEVLCPHETPRLPAVAPESR